MVPANIFARATFRLRVGRALWLLLAVCLGSGCVGYQVRTTVRISSKVEYEVGKQAPRYVLIPVAEDAAKDRSGAFQRVADYVSRALQQAGYVQADCPVGTRHCADADLAIFVDFGYASRTTAYYSPWAAYPPGYYHPYRRYPYRGPWGRWQGHGWYGNGFGPWYPAPAGVVLTDYSARLVLSALDLGRERAEQAPLRPWKSVMLAWVDNLDLDEAVPTLLAAAVPYLGADTGAELKVVVYDTDKRVCVIAGRDNCAELPEETEERRLSE